MTFIHGTPTPNHTPSSTTLMTRPTRSHSATGT